MDPITLILLFGAAALMGTSIPDPVAESPTSDRLKEIQAQVLLRLKDATLISIPPENTWVQVQNGAETWLVAPHYIAPVGIGEAKRVADMNGWTMPTRALVDAIYKQADLKLPPHPRGVNDKPPSDFTTKTMNSPETNIAQLAWIERQIRDTNPDYKLLAGTHKDVVYDTIPFGTNAGQMHLGIYGWQLEGGKNIQDFMWGHASGATAATDWKDYSQGLRPAKRLA